MISIQKNYSLLPFNTFRMGVNAAAYSKLTNLDQLPELAQHSAFKNGILVLGGGSNFLFTKDVSEWVIHNQLKGIRIVKQDDAHIWIEAGAGEVWHDFVRHCVAEGYGGIENLSLIPGYVGAAPVQNIGAYGAEAKDTIETVTAWHIHNREFIHFRNEDCDFGYRDSVFKRQYRNQVIITSVVFRLHKTPQFNTEYSGIQRELEKMGVKVLSLRAISDAVIRIRQSKLPDPKEIGNGGSFFKNPVIPAANFQKLQEKYPTIPSYVVNEKQRKIPAAWLIDQCGWKGFCAGDAGVHSKQPLVLVNRGHAKGTEIFQLSEKIQASVLQKFNIALEREVLAYL